MLKRDYQSQNCSIARTLELVGERWTLLIIRDAFRGLHRFDEFQANLGIATNVLASRLERLVDAGIFERIRYQERPDRYEYHLTPSGRELRVALIGLMQWGDRHLAPNGPPVTLVHDACGGTQITSRLVCDECGVLPPDEALHSVPGPGHVDAPGASGYADPTTVA